MRLFCFTTFLCLFPFVCMDDSILCTESYCKGYISKSPCSKLPEACLVQNSSYNGVELPPPVPCSCCSYCLENLSEGTGCAVGDPSSPMPTTICGDRLTCKAPILSGKDPICEKKINTRCLLAQKQYDIDRQNNNLGHLQQRPRCDRNGLYEPYVCVPGEICYCVSEKGVRLFGEAPLTPSSNKINCQCSRNYHKFSDIRNRNLHQTEYFRCQSNGDYDTLQCIGEQCFCVDAENGDPTYPSREFVNMTLISALTLPCFNNETYVEGEYYRECESEYREELKLIRAYEKEGLEVFGFTLPNCQLDGRYAPVQQNSKDKYCADPSGNILQDFSVPKSDPLSLSMNCKCARARSIMMEGEMPECCANGNYKKMQCRRGLCHCVDSNGLQIEKEVEASEKEKLTCATKLCD